MQKGNVAALQEQKMALETQQKVSGKDLSAAIAELDQEIQRARGAQPIQPAEQK